MDSQLWKSLVEKAILRTQSRHLVWVKTNEGPDKALSFGTSIDETTNLNIWGYTTNYSYELVLTQETSAEPFEESIRVTSKKNAQGIDFKSLFDVIQTQTRATVRDSAFEATMEYLTNPSIEDNAKADELRDRWFALGTGVFTYAQDEQILDAVRRLSRSREITWTKQRFDDGGSWFAAEIGDLLDVHLTPVQGAGIFQAERYQRELGG